MQGWRPSMEDAYVATGSLGQQQSDWANTGLFAVFDGHGGDQVSKFCAKQLPRALVQGRAAEAAAALNASFFTVDQMLADAGKKLSPNDPAHPDNVGCTAVACVVRKDSIIVANAGDSRAVLSRSGRAHDLSQDHKPSDTQEVERVRRAGGFVSEHKCGSHTIHRVNGQLSVSRAIGDQRFKKNTQMSAVNQAVSCAPDVNICKRQRGDEFLVIACDGIWDVLSSQAVVDLVRQDLAAIRRGDIKPADVISKVLDRCLSPDPSKTFGKGGDNMTMILVVFDQTEAEKPRRTGPKHRAAVHPSNESNLVQTSNDKDSSEISRRAERKGSFPGRLVEYALARVARTFNNAKL